MPVKGFFTSAGSATKAGGRRPLYLIPQCHRCGLLDGCQSPKMPVTGRGDKKVLIVGEAPGADEDAQNRQFVGKAGRRLRESLDRAGVSMRSDCWLTNSLLCHPPRNKIDKEEKIDFCRPNLIRTIEELKPTTILLLGGTAVKSLIPHVWKDSIGAMRRWAGWHIPCQKLNAWVCPTFHPSYVEREKEKPTGQVLGNLFDKQVAAAFAHVERPWQKVPNYPERVEVILDEQRAVRRLQEESRGHRGLVAFDYETTCLKPDGFRSQIVCCGIAFDGKATLAYPWTAGTATATKTILESCTPKVGANIKFEDRWTWCQLGIRVRNWVWCTMVNAHILDNRKGITSLKFQSLVLLGQGDYDSAIKPYLESKEDNGYSQNRVKDVDLRKLLLYCGTDALLELLVAKKQMKQVGYANYL